MDIDTEKEKVLIDYVEKFKDKIETREMVELYEFYIVLKAYHWMREENEKLKKKLTELEK